MKKLHFVKTAVLSVISLFVFICLLKLLPNRRVALPENPRVAIAANNKLDSGVVRKYQDWFSRDFPGERQLLGLIRNALANNTSIQKIPKLNIDWKPSYGWVGVTLFQQGNKPLRWISKQQTLPATINRITSKLRENDHFSDFAVYDPNRCRIMLEIITKEWPLDIEKLNASRLDASRFEPGITGFKLSYNNRYYFYMPTDAVVYSHLLPKHALNFLAKKIGVASQTNKISERARIISALPAAWSMVESAAFVTYGKRVILLYRGYPAPVTLSAKRIYTMSQRSVDWLCDNMTKKGRFLYYYDPVKDTVIDHIHPNRTVKNNYYNILRHSGGIIALLRMYELTRETKYIDAADRAIHFLLKHVKEHTYKDKRACYVYYNNKAKLGGTGVALVALMRYYQLSGDSKYNDYIFGMVQHLLSRITQDGEMLGYYIHPGLNNGKPIISPSEDEKKQLFSFYYPGEALLGLALFERQMNLTPQYKQEVCDAAEKALDFLVKIRPVKYANLFKPLPSDGWLMQAIEEWSYDKRFQKEEYLNFVFNDAVKMMSHTYTTQNAPYYDYPGTFYYNYGDHAYPDAARAEGLIAAYYLAERFGKHELAQHIMENCQMVAKALMLLYNSPESSFMHKYPNKSIGSFRFKFTRQWVRVDTVQHTVCFFIRLLSSLQKDNN